VEAVRKLGQKFVNSSFPRGLRGGGRVALPESELEEGGGPRNNVRIVSDLREPPDLEAGVDKDRADRIDGVAN
jgi:hypothetical protein